MMKSQQMTVDIVGSNEFGRHPKIATKETYNMIISDNWLVTFSGYKKVKEINLTGKGRASFNSTKFGKLIVVIDNNIYSVDSNIAIDKIAEISTFSGDVFIDENDASQIAICDKKDIYIFDYKNNIFGKALLDADFRPIYITFQNGYFIAADAINNQWRLSALNNGFLWPAAAQNVGTFQSKADKIQAVVRLPGKSNQLFVIGQAITELWVDIGAALFPYQKTTSFDIEYGCLNSATIGLGDDFVIWVGVNEQSSPVILYSKGGEVTKIVNDGIDFKLSQLKNPENSSGFVFKQDGHIFYQVTFKDDNLTYLWDFNTKKFFTLSDEYQNYHIARKVSYFNNTLYFISFNDGNLYELNSKYTTYDGAEIPRIRICSNIRLPTSQAFTIDVLTFPVEQGDANEIQRIDVSISRDGGYMFSPAYPVELNPQARRRGIITLWSLGYSNDFVCQFRFWGHNRFVAQNGIAKITVGGNWG